MRYILLVCVFLFTIAQSTAKSCWEFATAAGPVDSSTSYFVNTCEITIKGTTKTIWVKSISDKNKLTNGAPPKEYKSAIALFHANCKTKMMGVSSTNYYDELGNSVGSVYTPVELIEYKPVIPESVGSGIYSYVCGRK